VKSATILVFCALPLFTLLGGCSSAGYVWADQIPKVRAQPAPESNVIGQSDVISLSVVGHPELTATQPVGVDGSVVLPNVGAIPVGGLTIAQAEALTAQRLANILQSPKVSILVVTRFIQVSLLGEIRSPGKYSVQSGDGVADAIALAGGITEFGNSSEIYLVRAGEPLRIRFRLRDLLQGGDSARTFALRHGDILVVK
jgi:polysaccharide export outer membrane protein